MKKNKWIAVTVAAALTLTVAALPVADIQVNAASSANYGVYVDNQTTDISSVSISTPPVSILLYSGLTWEQLESDVSVRLNVSDVDCGAAARTAITSLASSLGGNVIQYLDMDLEAYLDGWTSDISSTVSPLRMAIALPDTADTSLDYAIIAVQNDGTLGVFGDLDTNPDTITVDCSSFDTYAIVSGPTGAFDAYKVASDASLTAETLTDYAKKVSSTISTTVNCSYIYAIGSSTDATTISSLVGSNPSLTIGDGEPGTYAKSALLAEMTESGAKKIAYVNVDMENGYGVQVTETSSPIRLTITVPYNFPAYGDYALAVLNADGSASIVTDIDTIQSTITVDTDQFREYAILWGPEGTFDDYE